MRVGILPIPTPNRLAEFDGDDWPSGTQPLANVKGELVESALPSAALRHCPPFVAANELVDHFGFDETGELLVR